MDDAPRARDLLPLPYHVLLILVAVLDHERHGYSMIKEIESRTAGEVVLGTSTLYAAIKRMVGGGLLEETEPPQHDDNGDSRRRYYRATVLGREVAREEALRIRGVEKMLVEQGLLEAADRREPARESS